MLKFTVLSSMLLVSHVARPFFACGRFSLWGREKGLVT